MAVYRRVTVVTSGGARIGYSDTYVGTVKVSGVAPIYEIGVDALNRTNASSRSWIGVSADTQVFVDATFQR